MTDYVLGTNDLPVVRSTYLQGDTVKLQDGSVWIFHPEAGFVPLAVDQETSFILGKRNLLTGAVGLAIGEKNVDGASLTRSARPTQSQIGAQIVDWGSTPATGGAGTTATSAQFIRGSSLGYAITVTAGGNGRIRAGSAATPLGVDATKINGIGLYLYNPQPVARNLAVYITQTADSYAVFSVASITVRPGAGYYTINRGAFDANKTGGGFVWTSGTLAQIQFTAAMNGAGDTLAFQTGETLYLGGVFINPRVGNKAKFMLWTDDGKNSNIIPAATSIAGGDGVSRRHSFQSLVASYGLTYSACIIGRLLGATNYMTVDQMLSLQDAGVMIANHCRNFASSSEIAGSTVGDGMRALGPYGYNLAPVGPKVLSYGTVQNDTSLIASEITDNIAYLESLGVSTAGHFVLPEGGFDQYVCAALDSLDGVLSVRGTGADRAVVGWAQYGFKNAAANGQQWRSKKPFWGGGLQLDISAHASTAVIQAWVDAVIASGGIGNAFLHDFSHTDLGGGLYSDQATKDLCAYLVTKESQIDVVTPRDLLNSIPYVQCD